MPRLRPLLVLVAVLALASPVAASAAITLSAPNPSTGTVDLAWSDGLLAQNYRVDRATGSCAAAFFDVSFGLLLPGDQVLSDNPPGDGVYCYRVTDTDTSAVSNTVLTVFDTLAPATPTIASGVVSGTTRAGVLAIVAGNVSDAGSGVASVDLQESVAGSGVWNTVLTTTTPPFTALTWDSADPTVGVDDGAYDFQVIVTDNVGIPSTPSAAITNVTIDNTGPTLPSFTTSPAAAAKVTGTIAFASDTPTDPSGVARVAVERAPTGTATWTEVATDSSAPYTALSWNSTGFDGVVDLRLVAYDTLGNTTASATIAGVTVDNTAPAAPSEVQGPAASSLVHQTVTVQGSTTDAGSGVSRVAFLVDGVEAIADVRTAQAWDTTGVADGAHAIALRAYDVVGLTSNLAIGSVTVDNTAPTAPTFLTGPGNGSAVRGTRNIRGSSTDTNLSRVAFLVDGVEKLADVRTTTGWNTALVSDGSRTIALEGIDLAGNTSSLTTRTVTVDNTAPTLPAATTAPSSSSVQASRSVTVSGNASDATSGVATVVLQARIGAAAFATIGTDSSVVSSYSVTASLPSDGVFDLQLVATDVAGNTTTRAVATSVTADTLAPAAVTWVQGPAASAIVHGSHAIQGSATDTNLVGVAFLVDGGQVTADVQTVSSWNSASVADGAHTITLRATDTAGNVTSSARSITVDNAPPTAPIVSSPVDATVVTGTVSVVASATDATSGVAGIALLDGATVLTSDIGAGYSWVTSGDGAHTLTLRATDNGGLTADTVVHVTVDNTAPAIPTKVQGPVAASFLRGTIPIQGSTTDGGSGVARVAFLVGGVQVAADVRSAFSWNTATAGDGVHALVLRAYDNVGLTHDLALGSVTVDNTAPSAPTFTPGPADGSAVSGTVSIGGTSTDTNLAGVAFLVGATQRFADVRSTASWNTAAEAEGSTTISLVATDSAGNTATTSRTVTIDNTPPALPSPTAPASGSAQATSSLPVSGVVSDVGGSGVASVVLEARIAPAAFAPVASDTSGLPGYSFTWTAPGDGVYDLRVVATDVAGNATATSAATGVIVDTVQPTQPVFAPAIADGSAVAGVVLVGGTSTDTNLARVSLAIDLTPFAADVHLATASWNTASGSYADGSHTLTLQAVDAAGNVSVVATRTVIVDNTPPFGVVITTTPTITPGQRNGETIHVQAAASDATTSVARIALLDGATVLTADIGAGYDWDTTLGPDGAHTLTARAYDQANNFSDATLAVTVDNLPPAAPTGATGTSPTNAEPLVTWDALTGTNDVSEWRVYADGSPSYTIVTSPTFTAGLALDGSADGLHTYVVRAYDGIHESPDSSTVSVTLDTVAPATPTFLAGPADQALVAGQVAVRGLSSDLHLSRVALLVDGTQVLADVRSSTPWDSSGTPDGTRQLTLRAYDAAGNTTSSSARNVTVDNTAPVLFVSTHPPSGSAQAAGMVSVSGTATDVGGSGVASLRLEARTGTGAFTQVATAGGSSPYALSHTLADGVWDLRVVAVDLAGNAATVSAAAGITVDTTAPTPPTFVTAPADRSIVTGSAVPIQGASSDANLVRIALLVDDVQSVADVTSATTWDTSALTDGVHHLTLVAHDVVEHQTVGATTLAVTVDNSPPTAPTITSTPAIVSGHRYGDTIVIHASASDPTSQITAIALLDGSTVLTSDVATGFNWDTTGVPDGSHTLTARARNGAGLTTDQTITIVVDNTPPAAPTVAAGASPTSHQPQLSWPAPGGDVVAWHVYRDGGTTPAAVTSPTFTDALPPASDGDHTYVVRAFDGVHESPDSAPVTITYDTAAPDSPTATVATARTDGSAIDVGWNAASAADLDHYVVRRAIGATAPATVTAGTAVCGAATTALTCVDTAIAEKTTYRYSVFAVDAAGNASAPGSAAAVTTADRTAPAAPARLTARIAGAKVTLSWPASTASDVVRYRVYVNAAHAPTALGDGTSLASALARTLVRQQAAGTTAYYAVFAQDAAGLTSGPAVVTVRIAKLGPVAPLAGTEVRGSAHLSWSAVRGATYYNVQVYLGKRLIAQAWPTKRGWTVPIKGLKAHRRYTWYVWPGIGPRRPARYGKLIGSSTFVWLGR